MDSVQLERDYFIAVEQLVNSANYLTPGKNFTFTSVDVLNLSKVYYNDIKQNLLTQGFSIVNLSRLKTLSFEKLATWQEEMLGAIMREKNSERLSYCKIYASPNSQYFVNSALSQPLHTDEGYTKVYPRYISLYCQHQVQKGGISTLFDFAKFYPILYDKFSNQLKLLAMPNAITVDSIACVESKPILLEQSTNWLPGISYCATLKKMTCSRLVFEVFDYITKYVHDPLNQIRFQLPEKHMLLIDNARILHGRTAFNINDKRVLYRYWFDPCVCF